MINSSNKKTDKLISKLNQKWKMWVYFLLKLPSAWFWGLNIKSVGQDKCIVCLSYSWFSKNPFHSIYFAAQIGAAELSTGLLGFVAIEDKPPTSMLITGVEAEFFKKAISLTTYTCDEGEKIRETVELAIKTGEGQTVTVTSTGIDVFGDVVSHFKITWSFKLKSS